jgi:hypothetical protein
MQHSLQLVGVNSFPVKVMRSAWGIGIVVGVCCGQ